MGMSMGSNLHTNCGKIEPKNLFFDVELGVVFGSPVTRPEKDCNQTGPRLQKDRTTGPVFSFLRCKDRKKTGLSEPVLTGLNRSFVAP